MNKEILITEVCHRFNRQYELTHHIANEIFNSLFSNKKLEYCITIDISKFECGFSDVKVNISKTGNLLSTYGHIDNFNPLEITIIVYKLFDTIDSEKEIKDIQSCVSHELMHGNIYFNTYDTFKDCDTDVIRKKINSAPDYYNDCLNIMHNSDIDSIEYKFAYALYSTYFQERQALIAQSDVEIKKILSSYRIERISYDNAPKILSRIEQYNVFLQNIEVVDEILQLSPISQVEFINKFNKLMIDYNLEYKNLNKLMKHIILLSKDALKSIEEILITAFYEINKL